MTIPLDEIAFHSGSVGNDPHGRLFEWNGVLYRGVDEGHAVEIRKLLATDAAIRAQASGALVQTEVTDLELDGYGLVLRHRRVPFVSYPFEWSAPMLKDGALAVLDLNIDLARAGYITKDPSSWNVLFDGTRPTYVDVGGIWPLERLSYAFRPWQEWYARFWTRPLLLIERGEERLVRMLQRDVDHGVRADDFERLMLGKATTVPRFVRRAANGARYRLAGAIPESAQRRLPTRFQVDGAASPARSAEDWVALLTRMRGRIERIDVTPPRTKWSTYYESSISPAAPTDGLSAKHHSVTEVLDGLRPKTVLDVGSSTGWYAMHAASRGATVLASDGDASAVGVLYEQAKKRELSIVPLVIDVRDPSPAYGLCGSRVQSVEMRFDTDLTLALALVHHLCVAQHMDFAQVVDTLSLFARDHLLVEFVAGEDPMLLPSSGNPHPVPEWYTLANFEAALRRRFELLDRFPSHPETRTLLLWRRS
jgi:SAM-dependent methyltransferase